ncbi:MAG TPA: hypothetical protein VMV27_09750 [Candidatus Binataceae bacterium]|nr:hypothetical protein [Candidatus Binataceae bacterium]
MNQPPKSRLDEAVQAACALFAKLLRGRVIIAAIDGGGGAGKSTLAAGIRAALGGVSIVRTDDFYRPLDGDDRAARDPEYAYRNYLEVERLRAEALAPLRAGTAARYQPREWTSAELRGWTEIPPNPIIIVEGVYSTRPELRDLIELAIFVDTPRDIRLARMKARAQIDTVWINRWMAAEDRYFEDLRPLDSADLAVAGF